MVHIPVLNIDVPEPRIAELLPGAVNILVQLSSRAYDAARDTLYPLEGQAAEIFEAEAVRRLPREFDRLIVRQLEGKIKNDDQFSSEAHEASYDWYRRMIRTAVAGASDEDEDDVTAQKLGLDKVSTLELVRRQYMAEHPEFEADELTKLSTTGTDAEKAAIAEAFLVAEQQYEQQQLERLSELQHVQEVQKALRSTQQQSMRTVVNASMGVAIALGVVKGVAVALQRFVLSRGAGKKGKKPKAPKQPAQAAPALAAAATAAATARGGRGSGTTTTQQQQQQQQTSATQAAASSRARTTTRKR
mmetsp:Transcript_10335/g.22216  ORF Transcript_10335/g.22216 Transcript_10335/m.22216 type:complete len:303 (+) Transcript_10335:105-1013(+)